MLSLLEHSLACVHQFSAASWFGALVYRTFFVDPKALRLFGRGSDYERFSLHLTDGMRGVALTALVACGLSGAALAGLRSFSHSTPWLVLMVLKVGLWVMASALFAYVSWVFWPRRVFAVEQEYAAFRRRSAVLSLIMIALAGLGILLGQVSRTV
jgi:hypothetical protein